MKYRTIVADPPWKQSDKRARAGVSWDRDGFRNTRLKYATLSYEKICDLAVGDFAEQDAHLFLWTTQLQLESTFYVTRSWGFEPSCTLVWCKPPHGWGPGGIFQSTVEFCIYARRGRPEPSRHAVTSQWFTWGRGAHSAKPEAFLDMVEEHFPGPYLELFARRQRLGWDTWGDEALEHVTPESLYTLGQQGRVPERPKGKPPVMAASPRERRREFESRPVPADSSQRDA